VNLQTLKGCIDRFDKSQELAYGAKQASIATERYESKKKEILGSISEICVHADQTCPVLVLFTEKEMK